MLVQELFEQTDLSGYEHLLSDVGIFITLNLSKISLYAKDTESQKQLTLMQQQLKQPILNGQSFVEVYNNRMLYMNPKIIPVMLKYIYDLIRFVEPRLELFVSDEHKQQFLNRLDNIKLLYKEQVQLLS